MTNHVHLLLKETEEQEIGAIVKRIAVGYANITILEMEEQDIFFKIDSRVRLLRMILIF